MLLPWVVGVRGVVDARGSQQAMALLGLSRHRDGKEMLRKSEAEASVEALVYMHKVRRFEASRGSIREWEFGAGRE